MALTGSGAISLNEMHIEAGGSSGTTCTINDSDIRGLISKSSGATMAFNEWYGASATTYYAMSGGTVTTHGNYKAHTFTSTGTLTVDTVGDTAFDVICIGGGGTGGGWIAGGGRGRTGRPHR